VVGASVKRERGRERGGQRPLAQSLPAGLQCIPGTAQSCQTSGSQHLSWRGGKVAEYVTIDDMDLRKQQHFAGGWPPRAAI
jgi:hypothetical protein